MKITRRQLKRLIIEELEINEGPYDDLASLVVQSVEDKQKQFVQFVEDKIKEENEQNISLLYKILKKIDAISSTPSRKELGAKAIESIRGET